MPDMFPPIQRVEVTIPATDDTSDAFCTAGYNKFNFAIPSVLTGATITFESAHCDNKGEPIAGDAYEPLNDDAGAPVSITADDATKTAGTTAAVAMALASAGWVRIVSASTEASARTFGVLMQV